MMIEPWEEAKGLADRRTQQWIGHQTFTYMVKIWVFFFIGIATPVWETKGKVPMKIHHIVLEHTDRSRHVYVADLVKVDPCDTGSKTKNIYISWQKF